MTGLSWTPGYTLEKIKIDAARAALEHHGGNKTRAAAALEISLRTLRIWIARAPELAQYRYERPRRDRAPEA